jgi:hypothetical protein
MHALKLETRTGRQSEGNSIVSYFANFAGLLLLGIFGFFFASMPADCSPLSISHHAANRLAVKVAVFSDDPDKFLDPRFSVTAEEQRIMLAPIGHATTTEPVLLQNTDDSPASDIGGKYGITAGTIFMVSPCIALTNYHVLFGQTLERQGAAQKEYKVKVTIGDQTGVGVPFIWGDFAHGPENDWAAISVTPCIGNSTGWFPISYTKSQLPREVSIFGFYNDRDYSVLAGQDCVLMERSPAATLWKTNCAMTHGTSGSPLGFFKDGSFQPTAMAFAMVRHKTAKLTYDPQDANFAIDLFHVFMNTPTLAATIADDIRTHGYANPARLSPGFKSTRLPQTGAPHTIAPAELPPEPQSVGLPPTPRDIGLPPTPRDVALPPTSRPIALPPDPRPLAQ